MYEETLSDVGDAAETKARMVHGTLGAYVVHSGMAGAYVGLGIVLIFTIGTPLAAAGSPFTGLVMAATFGVALSLVVVAGSDLFTGNTMVMTVGALRGRTDWGDLARVWGWSWLGNLAGSGLLAVLAVAAGTFDGTPALVLDVAGSKMTADPTTLFAKAILCNWLVVLAVWSSIKVDNEVARLAMIWWCLLAFIGSGYEHSVANMTLLSIANLLPAGSAAVSWTGMAYNLTIVTAGNVVSGAIMMGAAYWFVTDAGTGPAEQPTAAARDAPSEMDD